MHHSTSSISILARAVVQHLNKQPEGPADSRDRSADHKMGVDQRALIFLAFQVRLRCLSKVGHHELIRRHSPTCVLGYAAFEEQLIYKDMSVAACTYNLGVHAARLPWINVRVQLPNVASLASYAWVAANAMSICQAFSRVDLHVASAYIAHMLMLLATQAP